MRVLVLGPRSLFNAQEILSAARQESGFPITEIVASNQTDLDDEILKFCANSKIHLRISIPSRGIWGDQAMIRARDHQFETSDALIALFDGLDTDVLHCIERAKEKGMRVFVKFTPAMEKAEASGS